MRESPLLLIDTNVWLDYFVVDRPGSETAKALLDAAAATKAQLLYGASKLETLFYLIGSQVKASIRNQTGNLSEADASFARTYAWGCIEALQERAVAVGLDGSDLWVASKLRAVCEDFEDNVLLAAAKRAQVDYLVTSDRQLLSVAGAVVRAVSPQMMLTILNEDW